VRSFNTSAAMQSQLVARNEFAQFKEEVANMMRNKLGVYSGHDNCTTWEHISQYTAQLGEVGTFNSLKVHLFSLSLTSTSFSWFSSLAPNSIDSWDQLEQKFHDHFFSGSYQLKLTDLTSLRQGKEESVFDYLKRFKEVNNRCFNLSLTNFDLADLLLKD
jgi:uncharacterized glyoxalase superfamily metalloenzyme YdcJ